MIKIAAYTVDGKNSAGARLRSFYLFEPAHKYGISVYRNLGLLKSLSCDQLHLQMCFKPKHLLQALLFRVLGKQVIFDVCDQTILWSHKFAIFIVMKISSIISVDTEMRALYCRKYVDSKKIFVLPGVLDINPQDINKVMVRQHTQSKNFFWTGHRENLDSITEFIKITSCKNEFNLTVATNLKDNDIFYKKYPSVNFIQWKLDCIFDTTFNFSYMVLNHKVLNSPDAIYKSDNKMVLAIAAGIIPLVSRTPDYEHFAKELNAENLIFDSFDEIFGIIDSLTTTWIDDFFLRSKNYIIDHYSSENVFLQYKSLVLGKNKF